MANGSGIPMESFWGWGVLAGAWALPTGVFFFQELWSNAVRGGGVDPRLGWEVGPSSLLLRNPEPLCGVLPGVGALSARSLSAH